MFLIYIVYWTSKHRYYRWLLHWDALSLAQALDLWTRQTGEGPQLSSHWSWGYCQGDHWRYQKIDCCSSCQCCSRLVCISYVCCRPLDLSISGLSCTTCNLSCFELLWMYVLCPSTIHTADAYTLKSLRQIIWDTRSEWKLLGSELGVDNETLNVRLPYSCIQCKIIHTHTLRLLCLEVVDADVV